MKSVEPSVALGIYYLLSATLYCGILLPLGGVFLAPSGAVSLFQDFLVSRGTLVLACAGCLGAISYFCWYAAMKLIGVSRATALNVSYALWGLLLAFFFTDENITGYLALGAVIIFIGILLVIGKQKLPV
jgi:drug/metabolite transporter (DMT)-like permease